MLVFKTCHKHHIDKSILDLPSYAVLKVLYDDVHKHIAEQLKVLPNEQW